MAFADVVVHKSDLPVTCVLDNPPAGVAISLAQIFDSTGTAVSLGVSASGQSFVIPSTIAAGLVTLEVAVIGGDDTNWQQVDVVESTTPPTLIGSIVSANNKLLQAPIAVLS